MSIEEYEAMVASGRVQQGGGGKTDVCRPPDPSSYQQQAGPRSLYVEFDVEDDYLVSGGREDWASIPGPGSFYARLRGNFDVMPEVHSIKVVTWPT